MCLARDCVTIEHKNFEQLHLVRMSLILTPFIFFVVRRFHRDSSSPDNMHKQERQRERIYYGDGKEEISTKGRENAYNLFHYMAGEKRNGAITCFKPYRTGKRGFIGQISPGGVLDLNLYGDVPTKKNFFTLLQKFCLQMIPCSRKNQ